MILEFIIEDDVRHIDVGDRLMLVTLCWWQYFGVGDIFWMWVPNANEKECWWPKTTKTVSNTSKMSPTHFVSNISHQHRCSQYDVIEIQSRSMSDPPLSDFNLKNKMTWAWTTLNANWWRVRIWESFWKFIHVWSSKRDKYRTITKWN